MNYTISQLQIFLKVVENRSITKASEEMNLTQPAVSIQLKQFQKQFDLPLTEIINKKLFVTDFGKEIAEAARTVMDELENIQSRTSAIRGRLSGRLKLSVVSTGKYVIPYFLTGFLKEHPDVELMLDVTNKSRVIESLENNEVDFSLVSVLPDRMQLNKIELMKNKLFLVGNQDAAFPLASYDKSIFDNLRMIYREPGSGTRFVMERYIERNKIALRKKLELTSNEAVKQAVIAGLGYSIMPLIGLKNELNNKQIQIIPVKGLPIQSIWRLIWRTQKKLSPVAAAYLEYVRHQKEHIIREHFAWYDSYLHKKV